VRESEAVVQTVTNGNNGLHTTRALNQMPSLLLDVRQKYQMDQGSGTHPEVGMAFYELG